MRGFPFGALSSFERLAYSKIKRPCAEREAPHANSLSGAGACPIEPDETIGELFRARLSENSKSNHSVAPVRRKPLLCVIAKEREGEHRSRYVGQPG